MQITIKANGMDETLAFFKQAGKRPDIRPALKVCAEDIVELTAHSFRLEQTPDGIPWSDLAKLTIEARVNLGAKAKKRYTKGKKKGEFTAKAAELRAKRRAPGGIKKLDRFGIMKKSIFARATTRGLKFGSNVDYFGAHQGGTDKAGKRRNIHIDAREMIPVRFDGNTWHIIKDGRAKVVWDRLVVNLRNTIEGKPIV